MTRRYPICWLQSFRKSGFTSKSFCSRPNESNKIMEHKGGGMTREEAYRQLQNLDFLTAAKILFTAPPKKKKFGLDFHLVQLFFVCLPSVAVYLVAQYARADMKKMDEELHKKRKKIADEEKAVEEEKARKEKETVSELVNVKVRLQALEEVVKEIADETKKISQGTSIAKVVDGGKQEPGSAVGAAANQHQSAAEGGAK